MLISVGYDLKIFNTDPNLEFNTDTKRYFFFFDTFVLIMKINKAHIIVTTAGHTDYTAEISYTVPRKSM